LLSDLELDVPVELTTMTGAGIRFDDGCSDVMDYGVALGGNNLDPLNIAVLGQAGINQNVRPPVGAVSLHDHVFR